jgi:hypothetical protein
VLQPKVPSIGGKTSVKPAQDESDSSEDEESDSEDDDKPAGKQITKVKFRDCQDYKNVLQISVSLAWFLLLSRCLFGCLQPAQDSKKGNGVEESSEEDTDESDEESEEENPKTPMKNVKLLILHLCASIHVLVEHLNLS